MNFRRNFVASGVVRLIMGIVLLSLNASQIHAQQQFQYPNFNVSPPPNLQLNGSALVTQGASSSVLRLASAQQYQDGSAWYVNPTSTLSNGTLALAGGFTTTFQIQFTGYGTDPGATPGDGMAFLVQNGTFASGGSGAGPTAVSNSNVPGGFLGYTGLTQSVAVQFDTLYNEGLGDILASSGPSSTDEISIQSCGSGSNTSDHTAVNAQGYSCTFGVIDLSTASPSVPAPIYLADGNVHTVTITYVAPTTQGTCLPGATVGSAGCGTLSVTLDGMPAPVLAVPFNLNYLGILNEAGAPDPNVDAYIGFTGATGYDYQNEDVLSWSLAGVVSQTVSVNPTGAGPTLTSTFSTSTTGGTVSSVVDYSTAGNGSTSPISNPTLLSINNTLTQPSWPEYVVGTPWATSSCTVRSGNGGTGNLCSQYINECFDATKGATTASDANCPTALDPGFYNYVTLEDTFDWGTGGKQTIAPGTTVSLIAFTVPILNPGLQWNASAPPATTNPVCASIPGTASPSCYLSDSLVDMYGDQTTTRGSKPKSKAWLVSVYNVPMLFTNIFAEPNPGTACPLTTAVQLNNTASPIWVNGACLFDFQVNPAVPASGGTNNFQAAPPASLLYGPGTPAIAPGPITTGDTLVSNPNAVCTGTGGSCAPALWDTQTGSNAVAVITGTIPAASPTLSSLGNNGTFPMHWSAIDTVGITEKSITLSPAVSNLCTLPDGSTVSGSQCYYTTYFTTQVNIDSTAPSISLSSFSPAGSPAGTFALNQKVYPIYSCTDNLSGIANCGGVLVGPSSPGGACPTAPPSQVSTTALNTSTPGAHSYTVTATDCAGNTSQPVTVNYTVASPADVAIIGGATSDTAKSITYVAAVLDLTQGTSAYGTVITFQITDPKSSVSGAITGVFADVSCSLLGCSELPSGPVACSTSGDTVTCNVGTLPSIFTLKGAVAQITIPVVAKPQSGATIGITATVSSDDDPNPKNNSTSTTVSVK
jgi:hypothetical protein